MNASAAKQSDHNAESSRQMLTFSLGNETYGIDILRVHEIRGWTSVTRIPQTPAQVLGVLNLRGAIVPIVDLRLQLQLDRAEYTATTVIIVLSVKCATGSREFGVVVDAVSDVVEIAPDEIKSTPEVGSTASTAFISGIATKTERMVLLLDIDKLVGDDITVVSI